jgi:hypothetical protein
MINLRQELRAVQRSLREDVERLSTWIKIINIWAVPVLVALLAIGVALWRHARTARGAARPAEAHEPPHGPEHGEATA